MSGVALDELYVHCSVLDNSGFLDLYSFTTTMMMCCAAFMAAMKDNLIASFFASVLPLSSHLSCLMNL